MPLVSASVFAAAQLAQDIGRTTRTGFYAHCKIYISDELFSASEFLGTNGSLIETV